MTKRLNKCCCPCRGSQRKTLGSAPFTLGTWDLSAYGDHEHYPYRNKYWEIAFYEGPEKKVLKTGRIDKDGKLVDLPESVFVENGAYLWVRCHPTCDDSGYPGRVIAGNAGKTVWDLTPYKNAGYPGETGRWSVRQSGYGDWGEGQSTWYFGSIENGKLIDLPDQIETESYCELIIGCSGQCLDSLIDTPPHTVTGRLSDFIGDGAFPPGMCVSGAYFHCSGAIRGQSVSTSTGCMGSVFSPEIWGNTEGGVCLSLWPIMKCKEQEIPPVPGKTVTRQIACRASGEWVTYSLWYHQPGWMSAAFRGTIDPGPLVEYVNEHGLDGSPYGITMFNGPFCFPNGLCMAVTDDYREYMHRTLTELYTANNVHYACCSNFGRESFFHACVNGSVEYVLNNLYEPGAIVPMIEYQTPQDNPYYLDPPTEILIECTYWTK